MNHPTNIYGLMAQFETPEQLVEAARRVHAEGYRSVDAFTPLIIEELPEALGKTGTSVPLLVLLGGATGCLGGFFMQWFASVVHYPINVGGRPFNSWPAFIPITFELTVLFAGFTALFAMVLLNRLPSLYHPVFNAPGFERASQDGFFLCIRACDPVFERERTSSLLQRLGAREVSAVEW